MKNFISIKANLDLFLIFVNEERAIPSSFQLVCPPKRNPVLVLDWKIRMGVGQLVIGNLTPLSHLHN